MNQMREINVVIADDDSITRQVLKSMFRAKLRENRITVVGEAADGAETLALCARLKPDVLCLDINMPGMSGFEVLEVVKEQNPDLVVVMISGDATSSNVALAMSHGAKGFIVKPFSEGRVVDTILKVCAVV